MRRSASDTTRSFRRLLRGRDQHHEGVRGRWRWRRAELLQHLHRRHALLEGNFGDAVRLRAGSLEGCTSDIQTTPVDNAGTDIPASGLNIPGDPAAASILVKDKAVLDVTGVPSFSATIKYYLCGHSPLMPRRCAAPAECSSRRRTSRHRHVYIGRSDRDIGR